MNKYIKLAAIWLALGSVFWGIGGLKFFLVDHCLSYRQVTPRICEKSKKILVWYPNSDIKIQRKENYWPNDTNKYLGIFILPPVVLALFSIITKKKQTNQHDNNSQNIMSLCQKCGKPTTDSDVYCQNCGKRL